MSSNQVLPIPVLSLCLHHVSVHQVNEKQLDYTNCVSTAGGRSCADAIAENILSPCQCILNFTLSENYERDVFVYYGLSNFYQNHRRYVKSRDDKQLLGFTGAPSKDCEPFKTRDVKEKKTTWIAPCGAIANSLFNDTFTISFYDEKRGGKFSVIKLLDTGIAWATDKSKKFRNPKLKDSESLANAFKKYTHPPNWRREVWQLDNKTANDQNNGFQNEALIVWMRTAALPTFRKLYARIAHSADEAYRDGLPAGLYQVKIDYSEFFADDVKPFTSRLVLYLADYPVASFKGTKKLIISNTSWLGGKNPFLGVAYIGVGFVCLILSGVFLFVHKRFGKR